MSGCLDALSLVLQLSGGVLHHVTLRRASVLGLRVEGSILVACDSM